ncbi:type II toxin-antitoxin system RelE family toxin [Inconstantimicrobium porci]
MNWEVEYCDEAKKDIKKLDGSQIKQVLKAIEKVSTNPLHLMRVDMVNH